MQTGNSQSGTAIQPDFGKQYAQDDDFKARARLHQSIFRTRRLNAGWVGYGNRLAEDDALAGKNFYSGYEELLAQVQKRFPLAYTPLYYDMLRSQHIPWNLFGPLMIEPEFALALVNTLFGVKAMNVHRILVEHAPPRKEQFLDDNTSFDAYVEYVHEDSQIGAIGVEVKYTEREYPYGVTERKRMFNLRSHHHAVSKASGLYKEGAYELLRTKKLKQLWRNQLLGESMLQHRDPMLKHFTSALLYPAGNTHCAEGCEAYEGCMKSQTNEPKFVPITFERFIEVGRSLASTNKITEWLEYVEKRYIVAGQPR